MNTNDEAATMFDIEKKDIILNGEL